ncbi:leucine-rich_repeat domain-containing protein [Hexamita inflata]|uniref:Leucine-rich repeat domain-containing protein n=1 Tax=Hexamita inflata TaxID=28002 RepID=A0AA86QZU3_9EUKA|nr:leucine-rich repeat domain-containing protein [Hexamita inflata]
MKIQNQNNQKIDYNAKMTLRYQKNIHKGILKIGDRGELDVTNLSFIEKLDIITLILNINDQMSVKFRNKRIKELLILMPNEDSGLNWNVNDLELENLEVLDLHRNNLEDDQLFNLVKFKKLHTLDVSHNNVDLTNIHNVTSLTKLCMGYCSLQNIDQITSLFNLEDLDLSANIGIDITPLFQIKSLTKLNLSDCRLKLIEWVEFPTNLEVLDISFNQLLKIDQIGILVNLKELNISSNEFLNITPLKELVGLIKLDLSYCGLQSLSALISLINLKTLDLSYNLNIDITALQYQKNLTYLKLKCCGLVSICVLRPLINLKYFDIEGNEIVYLDSNIIDMKQLKHLRVNNNRINDFTSIETHQNFNNIDLSDTDVDNDEDIYEDEINDEDVSNQIQPSYFHTYDQTEPEEEELNFANKLRNIEGPNIQLKEIQNKHKELQTALNNLKQEINTAMNNAHQNQIQFTSSVAQLFQSNQTVSQ